MNTPPHSYRPMLFDFVVLTLDEREGEEEDVWGEWHVKARELHEAIKAVMAQPIDGSRNVIVAVPKELYIILCSSLFVPKGPPSLSLVAPVGLRGNRGGKDHVVLTRAIEWPDVKSPIVRMTEEQEGYKRRLVASPGRRR
jgi:hypothetical protein